MKTMFESLVSYIVLFMCLFTLIFVLSVFGIKNKISKVLYYVIQEIEIYGYGNTDINEIANKNNVDISCVDLMIDSQLGKKFKISVNKDIKIPILNINKDLVVTATTRLVKY
ncbi:MAG: hypothetical protein WBO70_00870 [Erysipelotrichaceae bacterium]